MRLGLGMSPYCTCWLVRVPQVKRIYASWHVVVDTTLRPLSDRDQRVFEDHDKNAVAQMRLGHPH